MFQQSVKAACAIVITVEGLGFEETCFMHPFINALY